MPKNLDPPKQKLNNPIKITSQQVNEDYNEQDWLMCGDPYKCTDQAIQENRTLVKLGYLTAATKLKGR